MSSFNMQAYPAVGSTAVASFGSPLMDCTNAISNSDNIINGAPRPATMKSSASNVFRGHLKLISTVVEEPVASTRHTHDPYCRTSNDGLPCVPRSPFTAEMSFIMSHSDEGNSHFSNSADSSFSTVPQATNRPLYHQPASRGTTAAAYPTVTINNNNGASSSSSTTRTGVKQGGFRRAAGGNTAGFGVTPSRAAPAVVSTPVPAAPVVAAAAGGTSVMRVPCKRVYVNGRPVIVSVNEEGQTS